MGGSISSLGIGSGVLTSDVIDQLREVDESKIVTPIENKITRNNQEQDAEKLLTSLMKTFKATASSLSYDTIFDTKSVDVIGKAEVEINAGANVESFTLETVTLAKKEITAFGGYASKSEAIFAVSPAAPVSGTLTIAGFDIAYDETTTLEQLAQSITDIAGSKVSASILQTGTSDFTLVLSSNSTGASSALSISDTTAVSVFNTYDGATNLTGYKPVQDAVDSEFKFNGITATRSTNDISDLIIGLDIILKEEGDFSAVTIEQDTQEITGELQLFADSYNTLIQNISDMIEKNEDTGAEGIFNGSSFIKGIKSELNNVITAMNGNNDSLVNYGIDIDRQGTMTFDKSDFEDKLKADPDGIKLLFAGGIDAEGNDVTGWFQNIDDKLKSYTGYGKLLSNFESDLKGQGSKLQESYIKASESLNNRYEIMTKRFIAYDAIISRINAQFASMQMMISAANNGDG